MSGASRRVKNPLLSAAGEGFPYENYTENALLVPVTPGTPAVLRDDAELDSFVGQEPIGSNSPAVTTSQTTAASIEVTPTSLQSEDARNTPGQPTRQGYFTSILSSLPNLSLSSITGDSPGSQGNQGSENIGGTHNTNPYVPSHDRRSSLRETSSLLAANPQDPRSTNLLGSQEVNFGSSGTLSTPPQPTVPPAGPLSSDGPISYRLGHQRRLKYAPPPDLTSNTSKHFPPPATQTFFSPQGAPLPPTILNPNEPIAQPKNYNPIETPVSSNSPSVQHSNSEQLSQSSSLQGSFRSSPTTVGFPQSGAVTPQSVPLQSPSPYYESAPLSGRPGLSASRSIPAHVQEPATPQNTPANVSFAGFELYARQRDFLATPNSEKEAVVIKESTSKADLSTDVWRDTPPGSAPSTTVEPIRSSSAGVPFTPISAVKVSEKLEHILAERKELASDPASETSTKDNENVLEAEGYGVSASSDVKSNEIGKDIGLSKNDSLTDISLGPEAAEQAQSAVVAQEVQAADIKPAVTESYAIPQDVNQTQPQYYQTQAPYVSPANFFAEHQSYQASSPNCVQSTETSVLSSFSDTSKAFNSASSFFQSQENVPSFPSFPTKEIIASPYADPITTDLKNNLRLSQEPIASNSSYVDPTVSVPQPFWNRIPTAHTDYPTQTCNPSRTPPPPPPPLFYNPVQLQGEAFKQPGLEQTYVSPVEQPIVNQTQQYFENFPGSRQPYDLTAVQDTVFLPTSHPAALTVPEPTGSATLNPVQMSANPLPGRSTTDTVPPSFQNIAAGTPDKRMQYRTVYHHWFYRKEVEHKVLWLPFSMQDSLRLEEAHNSSEITPETTVATDGGRYDVNILRRRRCPVYWSGASTEVRRCSWFFKGPTESRYIPYDESTSAKLEEEFKQACMSNIWNRRIDLSNGEYIIFHSGTVQVHYTQTTSPELAASWGNTAGSEDSAYLQGAASRPRVIKRGFDEFHIDDGEPEKVDHLLFLVHGIGSVCDLKFRTVEEVVDEFRSISLQLVQSHYRTASEQRIVNRIEVLPISWHTTLHSEDTGIDKKLQAITLESIPKLRHFTNDTLLDILFYTSPIYCQTIMQTVGSEMNRLFTLFKERNHDFDGGVYLGGHSLGSLILFDLLCHQKPLPEEGTGETNSTEGDNEKTTEEENTGALPALKAPVLKRRLSKKISYVMGAAGTGQPYIHYPQLNFQPRAFFALGSPIGMFVTVRGIDTLGENFALPTCPAFFNIFHPFDPVAYRVESLINPDAHKFRPMLIPHHKGRKRMHLELKETMARVGADLKQKLLDSVRNTWNSVYQLAVFHKPDNHALEREIDKVVEEQLQKQPDVPEQQSTDDEGADFKVGKLNGGRRVDYVLQEAPFEYINEYIFALTSHVCYWESEDTMLLILKEIYSSAGIQTDAQLPQQTLSIERVPAPPSTGLSPSPSRCDVTASPPAFGMDPTAPISEKPIGPPPRAGFVRKS